MVLAATQSTAQQVYPGLAGFLVVAGMGVAVYFLFRSLNKQLRKISPDGAAPKPGRPRRGLAAYRAQQAAAAAAAANGGTGPAGPAGRPARQPGSTQPGSTQPGSSQPAGRDASEPPAGPGPGPV
jgi:hypothetical protein